MTHCGQISFYAPDFTSSYILVCTSLIPFLTSHSLSLNPSLSYLCLPAGIPALGWCNEDLAPSGTSSNHRCCRWRTYLYNIWTLERNGTKHIHDQSTWFLYKIKLVPMQQRVPAKKAAKWFYFVILFSFACQVTPAVARRKAGYALDKLKVYHRADTER